MISVTVVVASSALGLGALLRHAPPTASGQQPMYAKLWPSFTMNYTIRSIDPASGRVLVDQTHRLVVTDEHSWRDDVVQDQVDTKEVGSFTQVKGGTRHEYSAARDYSRDLPLGSPDTVTSVRRELDPMLYGRIQSGGVKGWQDATSTAQGRIAKIRTVTVPCAAGTCQEQERVEFDAASINHSPTAGVTSPIGGIAVFGQRSVNGKVADTFQAQSLRIDQPSLRVDQPAAPGSTNAVSASPSPTPTPTSPSGAAGTSSTPSPTTVPTSSTPGTSPTASPSATPRR